MNILKNLLRINTKLIVVNQFVINLSRVDIIIVLSNYKTNHTNFSNFIKSIKYLQLE